MNNQNPIPEFGIKRDNEERRDGGCGIVFDPATKLYAVGRQHEKFSLAWATTQEILADWQARNENRDNDHWIYFMNKAGERLKELGY
jgi:hypothetical protein